MPKTHEPQHGTENEYGYWQCRCDLCKKAHAEYVRNARESRRARIEIPEFVVHGTANAFDNWGCKCEECKGYKVRYNNSRAEFRRNERAMKRLANLFPPHVLSDVPYEMMRRAVWSHDHRFPTCVVLLRKQKVRPELDDEYNIVGTLPTFMSRDPKFVAAEGRYGRLRISQRVVQSCGNTLCVNQCHLLTNEPNEFSPYPTDAEAFEYGGIMRIPF